MSDCSFVRTLPKLLVRRRGEAFAIALDWDLCDDDSVTVTAAESEIVRSPSGAAPIISSTTFDGSESRIAFEIASDQPYGTYRVHHAATLSNGSTSSQCFSIEVSPC